MDGQKIIKYSYGSVPTIRKFSDSNAFMRCLVGPFGSGKSSGCVVELVARGLAQAPSPDGIRRSRWLVVRNTYRQLQDATIRTVHQWIPPHLFGEYRQSDQRYLVKAFENTEIEILYRALDRPDHVANLLSLEVTGAWLNEARELNWSIVDAIQGRVGRYPAKMDGGAKPYYGVFMDTNPADTDSKLYKYFVEAGHDPDHAALFMQPGGLDDKAENLDNLPGGKEYYRKMSVGKDREWVKVYVDGQWGFVIDGRPVYPEYNDSVHCAEVKALSYETLYRGWDFGLTPSCVFVQLTPTGQFIILDEMVSEEMSVDTFSDEVIAYTSTHYPDYQIEDYGDPAGGQRAQTDSKTCFQILQSKGILIEPGMQSTAIRLESVRRPLTRLTNGKPGFQIDPRCKMLRKGFMGGYQYRRLQTSQEKYTSVPDKNNYSHPHDALQYVATHLFGSGLTTFHARGFEANQEEDPFTSAPRSDITGY